MSDYRIYKNIYAGFVNYKIAVNINGCFVCYRIAININADSVKMADFYQFSGVDGPVLANLRH